MIARAPGKLVLSGAYVVLDGAPAVVAAVDRYAEADAARGSGYVGKELRAAFPDRAPPFVDAESMRTAGRKLGLGSSAAALVAAIAIDRWRSVVGSFPTPSPAERAEIAALAFAAHRLAQGGGSGVDVVASAFGGVLACRTRDDGPPAHRPVRLPASLVVEAWICPESAVTAQMLSPVRALRAAAPARYTELVAEARAGAEAFVAAADAGDARAALEAITAQRRGMLALGAATGVPILPPYLAALGDLAAIEGAVFAQAGAGGGDIALFFGRAPSSLSLRREAASRGLVLVPLTLGAEGVHPAPSNLLSTSRPNAPN